MSTIKLSRPDLTSDEVSQALREGLGPGYDVQPGKRMPISPFGTPQADQPDVILVGNRSRPLARAQVTIVRQSGAAAIRVSPGGPFLGFIVNTVLIARKIRRVLLTAPGLV